MKLTDATIRIWVLIICLLLANAPNLSPLLSPSSFIVKVVASPSPPPSSSSDDPQDIIAKILSNKNQDDSSSNSFESIWKTFKNVLSSPFSSSGTGSSDTDYDSTFSSQDDMLNRRGLLMEQSLNEHYTHQFLNFLPQLKDYASMEDEDAEKDGNLPSETNLGVLRWGQPDKLTGQTCHCICDSPDSYWSFQWCPHKNVIFQGRRKSNGVFQPQYHLGTRLSLPDADKTEDNEFSPSNIRDAQHLLATAKSKYPAARAIHTYVDGDTCVEGGSQRRASVVVFHEGTSTRCQNTGIRVMIIESVVEVRVCQYMLHICLDRPVEAEIENDSSEKDNHSVDPITESGAKEINHTLHYIKNHITGSYVRKSRDDAKGNSRDNVMSSLHSAMPPLPPTRIEANRKLIKDMFVHAYDSYMYNGYPSPEVKPITCAPASFNLVKIPGLTLIDSLDTLVILGNYTEFARAVERLRYLDDNVFEATGIYSTGGLFSINHNVSVFETNIRVLGGLLSAHQLATAFLEGKVLEKDVWADDERIRIGGSECDTASPTMQCEQDSSPNGLVDRHWIYDGFLLELAEDIGNRLLPAFNTPTGIPYGTVNLISGIPKGETPIASLAGGGTLSLEMELLSRLTGEDIYGRAAKLATRALWMRRSPLDIVGKHICTRKGQWTETLSGIGSNSDSFYEYLIKHHILFPEDSDFWLQLVSAYGGVHNETRVGEWYGDVDMYRGQTQSGAPRRVLEALMAFYPGMQVLLGEITPAARTLNSFFLVREYLGFLPERFQFGSWKVDYGGGVHLLRPELLESAYFLHRSSKGFQNQFRSRLDNYTSDSSGWLWSGDFALHSIEKLTRTECGYGSIRDVSPETSGKLKPDKNQVRLLDEMPSYFLSETLKYLYLLFDDNNILHTDEERDWVFTTEAHPIHNERKEISADVKLMKQTEELKLRMQRRLGKQKKPIRDFHQDLFKEKWTDTSKMGDFVKQLEPLTKKDIEIYKSRRLFNPFSTAIERLFPNDNSWSPFDVFNERLQGLNPTFLSFRKLGNKIDLSNSCLNLYASDFLWIRALNGGIADYSDSYKSTTSDDFVVSESELIQLGSVDALALHGTGVHIKSFYHAFYQKPIRDKKRGKNKKVSNALKNGARQGELSNGSTRFEMGDGMGSFDISAFPGGSGFFVQHVESGETVVTTLIEDGPSDGSQGPLVLVYSKSAEVVNGVDITRQKNAAYQNPRAVVLADLQGNSYACEVRIIESKIRLEETSTCDIDSSQESVADSDRKCVEAESEDKIVEKFPCSPALFGPTHISNLEKVKSIETEAKIQPPGADIHGCGRFSMSLMSQRSKKEPDMADSSGELLDDEKVAALSESTDDNVISVVQRGDCTFQEKSYNKRLTERAEGVIVINNNKGDDLFVMSEGGSEELSSVDLGDYPTTVLVTWADGQKILKMTNARERNDATQIKAKITLVKDRLVPVDKELTGSSYKESQFWPRVKASSDALQIYSQSGWGIHAVQSSIDDKNSDVQKPELQWQLYLLKHDMIQESIP